MSYLQAPWTGVGSLQSECESLKQQLHRKADSHEITAANCRLDRLEHTLRQIGALVDELRNRVLQLEANSLEVVAAIDAEREKPESTGAGSILWSDGWE